MNKQLLLIRHAQAEQPNSVQKDFERELNASGIADASRMGRLLAQKRIQPDVVISSPAHRAKATVELIADQLKFEYARILFDQDIYEGTVRKLMQLINGLAEETACVLVFGHNPHLTYLAEYLTRQDIGNLPTCGIVAISFQDKKWSEVSGALGKMEWLEYPDKVSSIS